MRAARSAGSESGDPAQRWRARSPGGADTARMRVRDGSTRSALGAGATPAVGHDRPPWRELRTRSGHRPTADGPELAGIRAHTATLGAASPRFCSPSLGFASSRGERGREVVRGACTAAKNRARLAHDHARRDRGSVRPIAALPRPWGRSHAPQPRGELTRRCSAPYGELCAVAAGASPTDRTQRRARRAHHGPHAAAPRHGRRGAALSLLGLSPAACC